MENVRKHRDIKLVTTEARRNYLDPERTFIQQNLLAIEMKKTQIFRNKPVYVGLSIEKVSEIVMYEFWYYYVKPKYGEKTNYITWIQTVLSIKTEDLY